MSTYGQGYNLLYPPPQKKGTNAIYDNKYPEPQRKTQWEQEEEITQTVHPGIKTQPFQQQKQTLFQARLKWYQEEKRMWKRTPITNYKFNTYKTQHRLSRADSGKVQFYPAYSATTEQIFRDSYILPYLLSSTPQSVKFNEYMEFIDTYNKTRRPAMYRISRSHFSDDLGRLYEDKGGFLVFSSSVSYAKDQRAEKQLTQRFENTTVTVRNAIYFFTGLAGLPMETRMRVAASNAIDMHHMNENLWDIRPKNIAPLPIIIHRSYDHTPTDSNFFRD